MSESKQDWRLPKNIRQIGDGSGEKKIYVEDYVVTYLNRLAQSGKPGKAILFGEVREKNFDTYIFADGALETESFYMDDIAREELLEKMRKHFGGKRVVGWFLASEESPFVVTRDVVEIFEREFPGDDQILLVKDQQEDETTVFMMEDEILSQQPGYYIYYDKNTMMQEFMISSNEGKSVDEETEVKDDAIKSFRKIIKNKKLQMKKVQVNKENGQELQAEAASVPASEKIDWRQKFRPSRIGYLAGGFMVMTVMALGITMIYNYDRMKEVERSLARLTNNVDSQREYVTDDAGETAPVMLHIEETSEGEADPVSAEAEAEEQDTEAIGVQTRAEEGTSDDAAEKTAGIPETQDESTLEAEEPESAEQTAVQTASSAPRASYIVKVGDTLAGISEMYYGSLDKVTEICSLNGISDENTILPGQKILLP